MNDQQSSNHRVILQDTLGKAVVAPDAGGAIVSYDYQTNHGWIPILRPGNTFQRSGPFSLGCNVLLPFANRISAGGFKTPHGPLELPANLVGELFPIHGNAFQEQWQIERAEEDKVSLTLQSEGPSRFRYSAQLRYKLEEGVLSMELAVINQADETLPYGIGFHPWLAREEDSQLRFNAIGCWLEDSQHLPTEHVVPGSGSSSDFRERNRFPDGLLNNAYTGWDGIAELMRPQHGVKALVKAAEPLRCLQIYSPSVHADFVCIEPVNHTVDALNNVGKPGTVCPQWLEKDECLSVTCSIEPEEL
jgi:aldose 1-epimerase